MQLLIYILVLLATVEFNKQLIDNVKSDAKEQREWHLAQFAQWIIIYGSIMFLTKEYLLTIVFGCVYPVTYDTLLNKRRKLKWNHSGKHDLPKWIKYSLFIGGIGLFVWKQLH